MGNRLALLSILVALGCSRPGPSAEATAPAAAPLATQMAGLPTTDLTTLDNHNTELTPVLAGRVALVSLWATWCEACVAELESLNRLEDFARGTGGVVVAVAIGERRADVARFVAPRGLRYTQLVDEDFKLADALGQRQVPATLVVDRRGHVRFAGGALDARALAAFREALRDPG